MMIDDGQTIHRWGRSRFMKIGCGECALKHMWWLSGDGRFTVDGWLFWLGNMGYENMSWNAPCCLGLSLSPVLGMVFPGFEYLKHISTTGRIGNSKWVKISYPRSGCVEGGHLLHLVWSKMAWTTQGVLVVECARYGHRLLFHRVSRSQL